jgi:hypothetical protein
VDDPCSSLNIFINGTDDISNTSVPELAVGKWPNLRPTFDNLQWTSYDWSYQNLTIDVWDPNFDGGNTCGPYSNETCIYIIGVLGYCAGDQLPVPFQFHVHQFPLASNIFNEELVNQSVTALAYQTYGFCVRETDFESTTTNILVEFLTWKSSCYCPTSYVNLQLIVSLTNPNASGSDLAWTVDHDAEYSSIVLTQSDSSTRYGTCKLRF